jgi:hypothetical protein
LLTHCFLGESPSPICSLFILFSSSQSKYESSTHSSIILSFSFLFLESDPGLNRKLKVPLRKSGFYYFLPRLFIPSVNINISFSLLLFVSPWQNRFASCMSLVFSFRKCSPHRLHTKSTCYFICSRNFFSLVKFSLHISQNSFFLLLLRLNIFNVVPSWAGCRKFICILEDFLGLIIYSYSS